MGKTTDVTLTLTGGQYVKEKKMSLEVQKKNAQKDAKGSINYFKNNLATLFFVVSTRTLLGVAIVSYV